MGWGVWENVLKNEGTGEGAGMFIIDLWELFSLKEKKRKLMKKNWISKSNVLTHMFLPCSFIYFVQFMGK
jgi:hypothetical protein